MEIVLVNTNKLLICARFFVSSNKLYILAFENLFKT